MGESKRRSMRVQAEAAVRQAMAGVSIECLGDEPAMQFLLLTPARAEEARRQLGGLPALVERTLRWLAEIATEEKGAGCVLWWRSPDGCERSLAIEDLDDDGLETEVRRIAFFASARGYGVRLANYHSSALQTAWERVGPTYEPMLRTAWAEMKSGPPVSMDRRGNGSTELLVPGPREEREWPRLARELVRHFDRLSATRESFEQNYRRVEIIFDGYDDDPREVMDIAACRWIIRFVQQAIPHWRWFLPPEHLISWTGAAYASGPASVDAAGRMSFPVDQQAARLGLELHLATLAAMAGDLGINLSSPTFAGRVRDSMDLSSPSMWGRSERQESVEAGDVGFADSGMVDGSSSRTGGPPGSAAMPPVPVILDRSSKGSAGRRMLIASPGEFPPESVKVALESWSNGRSDLALVRPDDAIADGWVLEALPNDDVALEAAIDRVLHGSIERRESMTLLSFLGDSVGAKVEGLFAKCRDRVLASPPPGTLALTPELAGHLLDAMTDAESTPLAGDEGAGLLELAIEPGGTEVDMERLQFTDQADFAKVANLSLSVFAEVMAARTGPGVDVDSVERQIKADIRGWAREDGTLVVRSSLRGAQEIIVRAGCWRMVEADELSRLSREADERLRDSEGVQLIETLADVLQAELKNRTARAEGASSGFDETTSITGLFGRSQESLLHLRTNWAKRADVIRLADEWLGSDHEFFLLWRHREGGIAAAVMADESMLIEEGLPQMLVLGDSPGTSILIGLTGTSTDGKALQWWTAHGGALMPTVSDGEVRRH